MLQSIFTDFSDSTRPSWSLSRSSKDSLFVDPFYFLTSSLPTPSHWSEILSSCLVFLISSSPVQFVFIVCLLNGTIIDIAFVFGLSYWCTNLNEQGLLTISGLSLCFFLFIYLNNNVLAVILDVFRFRLIVLIDQC